MLWKNERIAPGATVGTIVVESVFDGLALTGFLVLGGILLPLDSGWPAWRGLRAVLSSSL